MDETRFWALIERVRAHLTFEERLETLRLVCFALDRNSLSDFLVKWGGLLDELHTYRLLGAAMLLARPLFGTGFVGSDAFSDLKSCVILLGEHGYARVFRDPDSLTDLLPEPLEFEDVFAEGYLAEILLVWDDRFDEVFPLPGKEALAGQPIPVDDLEHEFPRLAERIQRT